VNWENKKEKNLWWRR